MAKLFVGTSGYSYRHWEHGVFYPVGLSRKEQLRHYSEFFGTVELNSPFYHLPSESAFLRWHDLTPEDFLFAVKVSRFISHVKYLRDCEIPWFTFYQRSKLLKKKLGPFLIQLPPNWKRNLERLEKFIQMLENTSPKEKIAFEFRHISWFDKEVYDFFAEQRNITMVQADSARWPSTLKIAGSFVYVRMHGSPTLYGSKYSEKKLRESRDRIKEYLRKELDVYVYFNNDAYGFAIENAKELLQLSVENNARFSPVTRPGSFDRGT